MSRRIQYFQVAPEAVNALQGIDPYFKSTNIEPRLRALVELRTSQINGCAYCVDMHSRQAREYGETQQRLDCLPVWRETTFFDARERAALNWAETVTNVSHTGIPDAAYEEVKQHFPEKDVVDLTFIISVMNAWNRISISFRNGPAKRTEK